MLYVPVLVSGGIAVNDQAAALRPVIRGVVSCILGAHGGHADVEDCTHEVLRRALEGKDRLRSGQPIRPWVLGIARHVALDVLRDRKRTRLCESQQAGDDDQEPRSALDSVADPGPSPDERVADAEQRDRIRLAMDKLPEGQREALLLFHTQGLGYQQVSRRLGVPLGTVATWIARGRQSLAEALGETRQV